MVHLVMRFWPRNRVLEAVQELTGKVNKLMALVTVDSAQIDALKTAISTLQADTSKSLADIAEALKAAVPTADPSTAAVLTQAVADLGTLDSNIKAADPASTVTPSA